MLCASLVWLSHSLLFAQDHQNTTYGDQKARLTDILSSSSTVAGMNVEASMQSCTLSIRSTFDEECGVGGRPFYAAESREIVIDLEGVGQVSVRVTPYGALVGFGAREHLNHQSFVQEHFTRCDGKRFGGDLPGGISLPIRQDSAEKLLSFDFESLLSFCDPSSVY